MSRLPATTAPDLMGVADVRARYRLRDDRAARKVMDEMGAFLIAGRLFVRWDDLIAYEDARRAGRAGAEGRGSPAGALAAPRVGAPARRREPLAPDWWRAPGASHTLPTPDTDGGDP